jgi:PiT family inorganic phosphate transporter
MYRLLGGVLLGWGLGTNDAANVFGTAVASRMIRYSTAIMLTSLFVIIGALWEGTAGMETLSKLSGHNADAAMIMSGVAGLTVIIMTFYKLPVSTSQAVIGAILGMNLYLIPNDVDWGSLGKVAACWVGTPIGAAVVAAILYPTLGAILDRLHLNMVTRSIVLKGGLLLSGCYGAYALGANNVANVTGVYLGTDIFSGYGDNAVLILAFIGALSIAAGVLSYGKEVMFTVGSRLVQLGAFSALIAVLSEAITVHFYAKVGVPVSTSQAVVGAVLGIGIAKSIRTINGGTLLRICLGWIMTPLIAGVACYVVGWLVL